MMARILSFVCFFTSFLFAACSTESETVMGYPPQKQTSYGAPQHGYSSYQKPQQQYGGYEAPKPNYGYGAPKPNNYGSSYGPPKHEAPKPNYGYGPPKHEAPKPNYGGSYNAPKPNYGGGYGASKPNYGGGYGAPKPNYGGGYGAPKPNYGGGYDAPKPNHGGGYGAPKPNHGGGYEDKSELKVYEFRFSNDDASFIPDTCNALDPNGPWDFCSTRPVAVTEKCSGKKEGMVTSFCRFLCGGPAEFPAISECEFRFEFYEGEFIMNAILQTSAVVNVDMISPGGGEVCMAFTPKLTGSCVPDECDISSQTGAFQYKHGTVDVFSQSTELINPGAAPDDLIFDLDSTLIVSFTDKSGGSHGGAYPPQNHGGGYPPQQPSGNYGGGNYGGGYPPQKPSSGYGGGYSGYPPQQPTGYGGGYRKPTGYGNSYGAKPPMNHGGGYPQQPSYGGGYHL